MLREPCRQRGLRFFSMAGSTRTIRRRRKRVNSRRLGRAGRCCSKSRLAELFDARALPILVPPWNRFDDSFLGILGACGLSAISRAKPRSATPPPSDVAEIDIHVDLVAWAGNRGFIGEERALGGLVA